MPFCELSGSGNPPILLIHGFGMNRRSWYDIAPKLAETSAVHLVDLIGFGDSPAPEKWPYTMEAQASTLYEFIKEKGLSGLTLVGHSYGGGVALILLHKMREKGEGSLVKKLVLIAPAAYPQPFPPFIGLLRIPAVGRAVLKWLPAEFQVKIVMKYAFGNRAVITRERIRRYEGNLSRPPHREALFRTARNIIPEDVEAIVKEIEKTEQRTLLIYGAEDKVISRENLERLSETLPSVITKKIKSCGHVPQEEFPHLTAGLISEFSKPGIL